MASNLLVLCPPDPFAAPDPDLLARRFAAAGFLGEPLPEAGFYKPGEAFFQFVTFLGCSPVVALGEPGATAEICRIELAAPLPAPAFLAGANLKAPRCPGCGYRSPEGRAIGAAWERNPDQSWTCPACGRTYAATRLAWRHSAGFGRFFLRIWGVFEGEAMASESLLELLAGDGGERWKEFYLQLDR